MREFLRENARWLGVGFLLTFASAFGQTWFISLFAGAIKSEYGLTDGTWGGLYTVATLSAAAAMFWRGSLADTVPLSRLAPATALVFATAAIGMALGTSVWALVAVLFLLRLCGQGMFSHIAMTAMGRWFEARRGRAVSVANLGHPAGEVLFPVLAVLSIAAIGWRATWVVVAAVLVLAVVPLLVALLAEDRTPREMAGASERTGMLGLQWRRRDAARHWLLPALLPVLLTPGFIGTVVFFHQVHISEIKGWSLVEMAPGYSAYATSVVLAAILSGWAADRYGAHRLLPLLLLPMGIGIAAIHPAGHVSGWYLALAVLGITQGMAGALWGVLLPAVYGTRYLGSIRSMTVTIVVISTAIGPGITGVLIDRGFDFPVQSLYMGAWSLALSLGCVAISRRLSREMLRAG